MSLILANRLIFRRSRGRVRIAMNELARTLQEIIGKRSVEAVAQEWSSPDWTLKAWRLRDILRGHTKTPRDRRDLRAIARGIGRPYEQVVLMAFNANGDTPPKGDSLCPPETGRKARTHTASTS